MAERTNGYLAALKAHNLPAIIKQIEYREAADKTVHSIKSLLRTRRDIDALFFSTNYLALSGLEAIKELEITVGKDIGVAVFDDNNNFALFSPAITAVAQPIREIGMQVTKILIDQLQDDHMINSQNILLNTRLIVRDSSAPLP
jgi:LacI family transcriptional regulator